MYNISFVNFSLDVGCRSVIEFQQHTLTCALVLFCVFLADLFLFYKSASVLVISFVLYFFLLQDLMAFLHLLQSGTKTEAICFYTRVAHISSIRDIFILILFCSFMDFILYCYRRYTLTLDDWNDLYSKLVTSIPKALIAYGVFALSYGLFRELWELGVVHYTGVKPVGIGWLVLYRKFFNFVEYYFLSIFGVGTLAVPVTTRRQYFFPINEPSYWLILSRVCLNLFYLGFSIYIMSYINWFIDIQPFLKELANLSYWELAAVVREQPDYAGFNHYTIN